MKLTVVTVVYNAEEELENTFKSIFSQTSFDDIEYIVIDGGSTDNTKNIIEKYRAKIDVYLSEKDDGVYDAMNKAIDLSNCEWINFMNAGDAFYDTETVEKVIKNIGKEIELAYGDVHIFDGDKIDRLVKADLDNRILKETPFCHQSLFVKTKLMKEKKFNSFYRVLADFCFILDCYLNEYKFQYLGFPISRYRLGGMSQKNIDLMHLEGVKILMDAQQKHPNIVLEESPFYKGLSNSIGDRQAKLVNSSVANLAAVSFVRKPWEKFKRYKMLMHAFSGRNPVSSVGNVVHINTFDTIGGASRAVFRLNEALNKHKFSSVMQVLHKYSNRHSVIEHKCSNYQRVLIKIANRLPLLKFKMRELIPDKPFSTNLMGMDVSNNASIKHAKIIHLHWINYGYVSFKSIERMVALNKPIVWTLHDMWPMTGGCHNPLECESYTKSCGSCELLDSSNKNDISQYIHSKKQSILRGADLTIIAPSHWMKKQAQKSSLFRDANIVVIPNAINTRFFKKVPMDIIKQYFNFADPAKRYIVFGTHSNAAYKGLSYLLDALDAVDDMGLFENVELILFGDNPASAEQRISKKIICHSIDRIADDEKLRALYSLATIFVSPSLQESFGQVLTEAMACETACIAFNYSGSKDIVNHKENGYLAEYRNSDDIKNGLIYLLRDPRRLERIQENARVKVVSSFDYDVVADEHISLYRKLM